MSDLDYSYSADQIQQLLRCSVCLDRYKTPKILPCQHTFCHQPCLDGLVDRRTRTIRCPECRADHVIPRGGTAQFPNNLTIISFLELPPASSRGSVGFHFEEAQATGPNIEPVAVPQAAGAVGGASACTVCRREGRATRCGHCDQLVCDSCKRSHLDQFRLDCTRLVSQIRRELPSISEYLNTISQKGTQLQQRCETAKTEITEIIERHVRELRSRQRILHEEIDSFLLEELRSLRVHQENLEVELASLASFCDSSESALNRPNHNVSDSDLVEIKQNCVAHMATLRDYDLRHSRPPPIRQLEISTESQFLSGTINSYGEIVVSGSSPVQAASVPPRSRPSQTTEPPSRTSGNRTSHQHETPTDYALRVIGSRSSSLSPSIERRQTSPQSDLRSSQTSFSTDQDARNEERERRIRGNLMMHNSPVVRRRPRREHHSDTRIPGLMGSGDIALNDQSRRTRHRSIGALPPPEEETENGESLVYDVPGNFSRSQTFVRNSPVSSNAITPTNATAAQSQVSGRPSVRFDVTFSNNGGNAEESEEDNGIVMPFTRINNSPSLYVSSPRNKYNQKGQSLIRFGERGSDQAQFTWPRGVAVSPLDDNIYVADSSNHRVQVFDNIGRYMKSFGSYGQNEGEFDCLAGIAVNGLNQIIIADRYNHRIQIFDRQGNFQSAFGEEGSRDGQLNYPWGVACDNMGFIYVCDKENHRVQVFQSNGTFVRKFGRLGQGAGQLENPHYITVSPDNRVYVSDSSNHRIQVFSIYGDFLFSFGVSGTMRGQVKYPRGIAVDNQGFVVLADSGNNRIQIFRADGRFYSMFGSWGSENGQFKGLEGLAILANGNVVVSDRENHRIQIF